MSDDSKNMPLLSAVKLALTARKMRSEVAGVDYLASEPIAIVGMACRFPGGATSPERFWDLLERGIDAIREVPPERWDVDAYFDADPAAPGKIRTRWGGFVDQIDLFDAEFFGIAPREAATMDPQQRLLLEVTWEALDEAGYPPPRLAGSLTGIYLAAYNNDYAHRLYNDIAAIDAHTSSGTAHSISSGRIAYLLDLKGPCLTVDTACSSSLVAVHLAVQALRQRECRTALAGGVSLVLSPEQTISLSKWGMLAPDGRCKTFDARADGFVRGEGCGMVVLKRLGDALEEGDRILAVIRGSAVNHDGRSNALTAPNGLAQEAVIRQALRNACVDAGRVSHIEAHGTGTALGDPIEVEALKNVFGAAQPDAARCLLGSVKTNIGHLEAAAGIAGLIKVVLSLRHEKIPPHLHFQTLNPIISLAHSRLAVAPGGCAWPAGKEPRLAGVSSFGFGGTNAHVVLEEAPRLPVSTTHAAGPLVLPISARSAEGLRSAARDFQAFLSSGGQGEAYPRSDICYTAAVLRSHHSRRMALTAASHQEMAEKLAAYLDSDAAAEAAPLARRRPKIGFVFSGQESHWRGMGCELLQYDALFREHFTQCDEWLRSRAGWSPLEVLTGAQDRTLPDRTGILQPVLFALQAALAARLEAWGIRPHAVAGHGVGEVAAAHVGGALSLEQALEVVFNRGRLLQRATGTGLTVSVAATAAQARELIGKYGDRICIAADNGPQAVTLSGDAAALTDLLKKFDADGRLHKVLSADCAFHSARMTPLQTELTEALAGLTPQAGRVPIFSSVTGGAAQGRMFDSAYWGRHLREPVAFAPAIQAMADAGCDIFIEIGPDAVLLPFVAQILAARAQKGLRVSLMRRGRPERETLLDAAAALYGHGCELHWSALFMQKGRCVPLPAYPWQRERFWVEAPPKTVPAAANAAGDTPRHPLLGVRLHSPLIDGLAYRAAIGPRDPGFLNDHRILQRCVLPVTAVLEMAMAAALDAFRSADPIPMEGPLPLAITDVRVHEALFLDDVERRELQFGLIPEDGSESVFKLFSMIPQAPNADGGAGWTLHARGKIRCAADAGGAPADAWPDSLAAARAACSAKQDAARLYADFAARGLEFGPAFRGIAELWTGENSALARIACPAADTAGRESYVIHPAFLDSCLQVLGALLPAPGAGAAGPVYLPIALTELSIYKIPTGTGWSCARIVSGSVQAGQLDGEIAVFDDRGERVAQVSGLRLMAASREKLLASRRRSDDCLYEIIWQPPTAVMRSNATGERNATWIVCGDDSGLGLRLAKLIAESGGRCVQVSAGAEFMRRDGSRYRIDPMRPDHFRRLFDEIAAAAEGVELRIVHLFALEDGAPALPDGAPASDTQRIPCGSALHMVQACAGTRQRARLWLVTRGARSVAGRQDPVDAFQAPLWGLGGVIALEHPELNCTRIDLDGSGDDAENAVLLLREMRAGQRAEAEIAFRRGARYVPRLATLRTPPRASEQVDPAAAVALQAPDNGVLDDLAFAPAVRRPPARGEIEIAAAAVGLNFRDVLNALKMLPGQPMPLGGECAGRVEAVGEGVEHLRVGDEVLAFATDAFRSHVTVNQAFVVRKPAGMSIEEAASLPVVFLTAHYALRYLAKIAAGQAILIHAAAGGVGLAAVQIARAAGAEIFATAGSPAKRDYLRSLGIRHVMDSRSVAFADQVMEQTGGRGVDIVLNSLSGEMIPKSLSVVCPGGIFVEIGKRDIWDERRVAEFRSGIAYRVFDLATVAGEQPELIRTMLGELMPQFAAGDLAPLKRTVFDRGQAAEAFRSMARAQHIGKIVVRLGGSETKEVQDSGKLPAPDGTYLITGGLGALGLHTARWLIERGARHLALAGRRAPSAGIGAEVAALQKPGVQVAVWQADLANHDDVLRLLDEIGSRMPPLRGIVHAAGVLDDGALLTLDWTRFRKVLAPKMDGAWHLHRLTRHLQLDFFICFSSAASVIGWPGQGNYAAANAFLDALAHQRRREGIPALSINWGPWRDGGMAAETARDRRQHFAAVGFDAITPVQGAAALAHLVGAGGQVVALPVDWERFRRSRPGGPHQALLESVMGPPPRERVPRGDAGPSGGLRATLSHTPPGNRMALLLEHLERQAAQVLGLPPGRGIEPLRPLNEIGLDSLMAVELRNALSVLLALPLPATLLFDYPSLQDLARYLAEKVLALDLDEAGADRTGPESEVPPASDLAAISDQEAETMLLAELDRLEEKQDG